VDPAGWAAKPLPDHLQVRVQVVDEQGRPLVAGRDLAEVRRRVEEHLRRLSAQAPREDPDAWRRARTRWEKEAQTAWTFGDVPARVAVGEQAGVPVYAYPALVPEAAGVALRLRRSPEAAAADGRRGLFHLFELELRYELAWLERDLRALRELGVLAAAFVPVEQLQAQALAALRRWACGRAVEPLTGAGFAHALDQARADLRGIVPRLTDLLREILTRRQALLLHAHPYPDLAGDQAALLPADFLAVTPWPRLAHFPRYLRAMEMRADRWRQNAARDAERAQRIAPPPAAMRSAPAPVATPPKGGPLKSLGALDRLFPRG